MKARCSDGRVRGAVLALLALLAGCVDTTHHRIAIRYVENVTPREQVSDYRLTQCDSLWHIDDRDAVNNALYWLRAMGCAERLTPQQAREVAQTLGSTTWNQAFKQSILLDQVKITPAERRQALDRLNGFQTDFPAVLRPLLQTWQDKQTFWLALTDERIRTQRLQEANDKQLEAMRVQQSNLQYQLDVTTRKLENLTDIERQLSTRKAMSSELPEPAASHESGAVERHGAPAASK
ncbi:two-component system QseEF-associated lipoprotein QseG [Candidatus Symbiopectobacterium sp.]|uniref:two-component system QseEF-associated lipoprotein QseG n=1 Tax=Candidatus Symbiopectobacterium sp. TaxID=2816440 RepID=UPI0025C0AACC|nr:two-component system QseEF-associated lipoprotein QseG [Candidatus Symbiopectobacterium sp.]